MAKPRWFVEVGQRIGRGVVIEAEVRIPRNAGRNRTVRVAKLLCDCGTEYVARIGELVGVEAQSGHGIKSCGCLSRQRLAEGRLKGPEANRGRRARNFIDRAGLRYGHLVVIEPADPKIYFGKRTTHWLCRCDCGNEVTVQAGSLAKGATKSCGCAQFALKLPPGMAARNKVLKAYRGRARQRGLAWELSEDDFNRLTLLDCFYCGCPPSAKAIYGLSEYVYNGLDRMDNNLGYTLENVVPSCRICNNAKKDFSFEDFMAWIARLTEYRRPESTPSRLRGEVVQA